MRIIACEYVPDYRWVKRGFFERWFTWPWHPLIEFKATNQPYVLMVGNVAFVSFATYAKMERGLLNL